MRKIADCNVTLYFVIFLCIVVFVLYHNRHSYQEYVERRDLQKNNKYAGLLPFLLINEQDNHVCFESSPLVPKIPKILKTSISSFGICHTNLAGGEHVDAFESVLRLPLSGIFVDIGANAGVLTMLAASLGRKVVAFEMIPGNVLSLTSTIGVNRAWDRVILIGLYAASEKSKGTVLARDNLSGSQLNGQVIQSSLESSTQDDVREFPAISPYDVLQNYENIYLMKIDVEGSEGLVARGLIPLLRKGTISMVHSEFAADNIRATSGVDPSEYLQIFFDSRYWVLFDSCVNCPSSWSYQFHQDTLSLIGQSKFEELGKQMIPQSEFKRFSDSLNGWYIVNVLFVRRDSALGKKM